MMLSPVVAMAYDAEIDGIYYNFNGTEATVTSGDNKYSGNIVIPETVMYFETECSVTSIGERAFYNCTDLTAIMIPNNVTTIDITAFRGCRSLASIVVKDGNTVYDSRNNCNAIIETASNKLIIGCQATIIPGNVTSIGTDAFDHCNFSSITIPNSVKSIDGLAFFGASITSVVIPKSVESIGSSVFCACHWLNSIVVEDGNKVYDSRNNCNAIIETASNTIIAGAGSTIIPEDVTSIGDGAFDGISLLSSIYVPNSVTSIGIDAFRDTKWYLDQPDGLVYTGKMFYKYKGEMPDNTAIDIREGTLGIAGNAFSGCTGLSSITIPESVTNIGCQAFAGCSGLSAITIPNKVTSIGYMAFEGCSNLTSVTIPKYVMSIGDCAFVNCTGLTSVTVNIASPVSINSNTFNYRANATLYVPYGCKAAYETADYWNEFKEIVEMPSPIINFADANVKAICVANWDTDGDGELVHSLIAFGQSMYLFQKMLCDGLGRMCIFRIGHIDNKFISAEAGDNLVVRQKSDLIHHGLQVDIADHKAFHIVDFVEMINIEDEQAACAVSFDLVLDRDLSAVASVGSRQLIQILRCFSTAILCQIDDTREDGCGLLNRLIIRIRIDLRQTVLLDQTNHDIGTFFIPLATAAVF